MNILVLNASPKAKTSITLQNALYLEKKYPAHKFEYIHIGVGKETNRRNLDKILGEVEKSDLVIFSFPVYTFLSPSQLNNFIRLLKEENLSFRGKKASCITTSKHFYDMTAHRYLEENLLDLGFDYIEGLSLDMEDLLKEEGRDALTAYFERTLWAMDNNIVEKKTKQEEITLPLPQKIEAREEKKDDYTVTIVADYTYNRERLGRLVENFRALFPYRTKVVELQNFSFRGGCLGCLRCALEGKCVYTDGFNNLLENEILSSDAVVYAFTLIDHSMGPLFKTYDDRRFYFGHRTVTEGKSVGYIIDGDISKEENLKTVLTARSDVGRNYLSGLATDNPLLERMAENLTYSLNHRYSKPRTFYGVGGMKIFRDLIWMMRGIMRDDHRFYKENGFYDFPQKERGRMLSLCLVGALMRNKKLMRKHSALINEGMLAPYKKVIEKA